MHQEEAVDLSNPLCAVTVDESGQPYPNTDQLDTDCEGVGDACEPERRLRGAGSRLSGCATEPEAALGAWVAALLAAGLRRRR